MFIYIALDDTILHCTVLYQIVLHYVVQFYITVDIMLQYLHHIIMNAMRYYLQTPLIRTQASYRDL